MLKQYGAQPRKLERFVSPWTEVAGNYCIWRIPCSGEAPHGAVISVNNPKSERAMDDDWWLERTIVATQKNQPRISRSHMKQFINMLLPAKFGI